MTRLRTSVQASLVTGFGVVIIFLYYLSLATTSNILNLLGVLTLGLTSLLVIKSKGGWIFLLYAFGLTFALASGALIELTGAFLIEIRETAYLTGAAARNSLLATLFLVVSFVSYNFFLRLTPSRLPVINTAEPLATRALLAIAFAAPLYIASVLITYGSPLLMGMDRFKYFTYIAPPGYKWLYGNIPLLGFVVALSAYKGVITHSTSFIWLMLTVVIYIMAGEKFSKLFLLGFFFLLPFFLIASQTIKTRHLALGVMTLIILASLTIFNYVMISGSAEIFIPRLALQGQMNYALDLISGSPQPLPVILKHFIGHDAQEIDRGLVHLMYLVAPSDVVDLRIESGATFTAPFPANISYFFGKHLAPLFIIFLSMVFGSLAALLRKAISSLNIIFSGLVLKTFLLAYVAIMMGEAHLLIGSKGAIHFLAIATYLLIAKNFSRKHT